MMKKTLLFVCVLVSTTLFSQNFTDGGINYTVTDPTNLYVEVGNNSGFSGDANIPTTVTDGSQNYTVISIRNLAFYNCTALTSVTVGNSVTSIGNNAFSDCTALITVTIGNSVTSIEEYAFAYCSALTSLTIGNSVTTIGNSAFSECSGLTSVTIPNSVTVIGEYAFARCSSLISITIPNSVNFISEGTFYNCLGLTSVIIPNSVNSIGDYAFLNCPALTSVTCTIPTPLVINANVFGGTTNQATCDLYTIDATSQALYQAAPVWQNFRAVLLGNDNFVKAAFIVYPNPASDILTIELENNLELQGVNFHNALGQIVKTSNTTTTNISELAKGSYFIEVITNEGKATKTIIVK